MASSAIRAFISALKLRRCLDFISAPFPRQRFYTLLSGPNFGEHFKYRPEIVGTRHRVIVPYSGNWGTLVENNGVLKLVVEGRVFGPTDDLRGGTLEVRIAEPQKVGTLRVVQEWNRAVE